MIELQTTNIDPEARPMTYKLPNGKVIRIGKADQDFFRKLQKLPAPLKIFLMNLTDEEMSAYMLNEQRKSKLQVIEFINKTWYWRDTGDPVPEFSEIPGTNHTIAYYRSRVASGRKFSKNEVKAIIEFYTNDRSEVYLKDDL